MSVPRVSGGVRGGMRFICTERAWWYAVRYRVFPYRKGCILYRCARKNVVYLNRGGVVVM